MKLRINDEEIQFTLQDEKTVNDILKSLEQEFEEIGQSIDKIIVNGRNCNSTNIEKIIILELKEVETISVYTSPLSKLYYIALFGLKNTLLSGNSKGTEEDVKETEQDFSYIQSVDFEGAEELAKFFKEKKYDLAKKWIDNTMNFLEAPFESIQQTQKRIEIILPKVEEISVLFQTGKDKEIIQNVAAFSELTATLLETIRLIRKIKLFPLHDKIGDKSVQEFLEEYNNILSEFLNSIESGDTVLTGDLAEYEIVPKTKELLSLITQNK